MREPADPRQKPTPWWDPSRHADRRPLLLSRNRIKAAIRARFEAGGFTEVECGALQASPGNEAHLHGVEAALIGPGGERRTLYLHTSPEFAAKKLLAAGERRIFDFARVFRNRERGALHAPEFTMLEWYRAGETWDAAMADTVAIVKLAAETTGINSYTYRGRACDPRAEAERLPVVDAFARHAGVDLMRTLTDDGEGIVAPMREEARRAGIDPSADDTWADLFSKILVAHVEPRLGEGRPTLLTEYPACEAALARRTAHDRRVSERFELYACGVELANGFGELTDPVEQRRRFELEMAEKQRVYGERYPIDEDLLAALALMPDACGVALGFDRLVMLATGAARIDQVLWTPAP
ncbi:MAG: EF-P lysine aminoacylase EpmA [Hyphomicrobiales bacterium]